MKKVILIASVAVISVLASCSSKKDWTCTCAPVPAVPLTQLTETEAKTSCPETNVSGIKCVLAAK